MRASLIRPAPCPSRWTPEILGSLVLVAVALLGVAVAVGLGTDVLLEVLMPAVR